MKLKLFVNFIGIIIAFLLGALVVIIQGYNPFDTYAALFTYSLGDWYSITTTLHNSVPLILTGLSASIAITSGPVNLGQPGQLLIGALCVSIVGLFIKMPPIFMIPFLLMISLLSGAFWAGLAAVAKRWFKMNEVITTLMLNFIADYITLWAILFPFTEKGVNNPQTPLITKQGWIPQLGNFSFDIVVMLLVFISVWFLFYRTTLGYELRVSGKNSIFARLGGVRIDHNCFLVMLLSGALAGLAGGLIIMSGPHRFIKGLGANYAWDGIMIAMVANSGIVETLLYGFFFAILQTGAIGMEIITAVPSELIKVIQALVLLIVVSCRTYFRVLLGKLAVKREVKERYI